MKKLLLLLFIATLSLANLSAQEYTTGLGVRAGNSSGLSVKYFFNGPSAVEGIASFYFNGGMALTALYELQAQFPDVPHLYWFVGIGGGIASSGNAFGVSVDGIVGMEYNFTEAPLSLGLDFKPYLSIAGTAGLYPDMALSIRYLIR